MKKFTQKEKNEVKKNLTFASYQKEINHNFGFGLHFLRFYELRFLCIAVNDLLNL